MFCISVVSAAISVRQRELENAAESAFNTMSRTSWGVLNLVSGQSAYIDDLVRAIEHVVETATPLIEQKRYLRNFFDKAAR